jgi:hypothetical protein
MILAAVAVGSEREHELLAVSRTLYHCPRVLKYVLTADCVAVFTVNVTTHRRALLIKTGKPPSAEAARNLIGTIAPTSTDHAGKMGARTIPAARLVLLDTSESTAWQPLDRFSCSCAQFEVRAKTFGGGL